MLKKIRRIIAEYWIPFVVLGAIGVFLLIGWMSSLPPTGEICRKNEYTGQKDCATYHIALVVLWHVGEAFNYYGIVVAALATVILAWYTSRLWGSTATLVKDTGSTAKTELRAYLGIVESGVVRWPNNHIQANITIRNTGQTPALRVSRGITAEIQNSANPGPFPMPAQEPGRHPMAPGATWTIRRDIEDVSPQDMSHLETGHGLSQREMFVWGSVEYWDIYERRQTLTFRLHTHARRQTGGVVRGWDLHPTDEGNDTTQNEGTGLSEPR